jgi:aminoglycoside phosphotransferase (APT) family kinase protein
LISEFRHGIAISKDLPPALANVEDIGGKLSFMMVDAVVELHGISPERAGPSDLGKATGFMGRQIHGWHKRVSRVMPNFQLSKVDVLRTSRISPGATAALVHLDFKPPRAAAP